MIAVVEAARAGLFQRQHWASNIVAGLIVGVVALPLAMAFAIASGVKPEQGLYTAVIAGICVSLFGGSRIQIAGPTGAFIVILAGITAKHGVEGLMLATMMAGVMLILLGAAKFGGVIRFIPDPVIVGFTAGIGVIIWVGQWRDFFGLPKVGGEHFHEKLLHLLQVLPQLHPATTLLALASLLLVIYGPRLPGLKRVPGPLLAMVAATGAQALFHFEGVATIASTFGGIPQGLPHFSLLGFSLGQLVNLLPAAFAIAMLGAIESLLSAVVADNMAGTRHDSNQELIGQGIANVLAPLFGGFAATGAIARTATNFRNGANSPLAGVVHALTLVLVLLLLAPLAGQIPLCALSAILFVVAWNMSEAHRFLRMLRTAPRADMAILLITFLLTVFADLVIAVNIGVILAMLHFMRRMSSSVEVRQLGELELGTVLEDAGLAALPPATLVYEIEGPLFFGAVENLERVLQQKKSEPRCVLLRLNHVPFMDITGIQTLEEVIQAFEHRGVRVLLCEANARVLAKLVRAEIVRRDTQPVRYYRELSNALQDCQESTAA
ncbi:sulfate permease, SulP family [Solimonas aquatica]|uniref:Sulfate permease, SulP family n=1 Tax=Solimonas aquatica TaxID=489703 RepID=A0A1H9KVX2_9GAMM|nr:SulP family inorganic anion transporter [Solimonas aquatica]SER03290.1 sulfate permease, SulP family [Solimonas aquatica]